MDISEIIESGLRLKGIFARPAGDECLAFEAVLLEFENSVLMTLEVNADTDELILQYPIPGSQSPSADMVAIAADAWGALPIWSWMMTNQKGYFDAFQVELVKPNVSEDFILQFKTMASMIFLFLPQMQRSK